ncbi:TadE/TadG family type IV pilus assembly protein [Ruania rhizosphaerae]|uniref:TadE/TadG family type IV pilus assembly protein n=1 Tax=Ruania rhizosphaerae TaxID=1840413 RepID=UPI00135CB111|nr:TadE/TadG family type IV pilus assembly protein [Ruania rhizosphaerae]
MNDSERGSALVDFLLVSVLVTALVLGVIQLALTLHVRTVLVDAAAEGARYAALHESALAAGQDRTAQLIGMTLPEDYASDVSAETGSIDGVDLVEVHVRAPIPVLGLFGPSGVLTVTGRAVAE